MRSHAHSMGVVDALLPLEKTAWDWPWADPTKGLSAEGRKIHEAAYSPKTQNKNLDAFYAKRKGLNRDILEDVSQGLEYAGYLPVVGTGASLAGGALGAVSSARKGNWGEAGIRLGMGALFAIPGAKLTAAVGKGSVAAAGRMGAGAALKGMRREAVSSGKRMIEWVQNRGAKSAVPAVEQAAAKSQAGLDAAMKNFARGRGGYAPVESALKETSMLGRVQNRAGAAWDAAKASRPGQALGRGAEALRNSSVGRTVAGAGRKIGDLAKKYPTLSTMAGMEGLSWGLGKLMGGGEALMRQAPGMAAGAEGALADMSIPQFRNIAPPPNFAMMNFGQQGGYQNVMRSMPPMPAMDGA